MWNVAFTNCNTVHCHFANAMIVDESRCYDKYVEYLMRLKLKQEKKLMVKSNLVDEYQDKSSEWVRVDQSKFKLTRNLRLKRIFGSFRTTTDHEVIRPKYYLKLNLDFRVLPESHLNLKTSGQVQ